MIATDNRAADWDAWEAFRPRDTLVLSSLNTIHAVLLSLSAVGAVVFGGLILWRNPSSTAARLHWVYALTVGWWFGSMALISTASSPDEVWMWSRVLHVGLGTFPAVIYHLNISIAGLATTYRRRVRLHWQLSLALTAFLVTWPWLFVEPATYAWGLYPRYSAWGSVLIGAYVVVLIEIMLAYRVALQRNHPMTARHRKARAFVRGNMFTSLAIVDFMPAFGVPLYPFGYAVMTVMHALTLYGSVRYKLIEITPEFAASHILEEMPAGVIVIDTQGLVQLVNRRAATMLGTEPAALVERPLDPAEHNELVRVFTTPQAPAAIQEATLSKSGPDSRHIRLSAHGIKDQAGFPIANLWMLDDITERRRAQDENRRLEDSIRQTQKLESLGVMASGVAHDFNNLLLAILGHSELARLTIRDPDAVTEHLDIVEAAVERASDLTYQMLTYTGERPTERKVIHLSSLVADMADLVKAAVSKKTHLRLDLTPTGVYVRGDAGQLSQVVLNLITNASEALEGEPGTIEVRTGVFNPDRTFRLWGQSEQSFPLGPHAFLEVRDSGIGMDEQIESEIFDPFFTTKFAGRGLGLATVAGIVRSHRGLTRVKSRPGHGTTFTVAIPVSTSASADAHTPELARDGWRAHGLALLADDEPEARAVTGSMLSAIGFDVIEACDGHEAVGLFRKRAADIAIVILDQTMPKVGGHEAFSEIRAISPLTPVVIISGYADPLANPTDGAAFLRKPFRVASLTATLRRAMTATDAPRRHGGADDGPPSPSA